MLEIKNLHAKVDDNEILRGIDLAVVPLRALGDPEVIVEGLRTPPYARVGDNLASVLQVYSSGPATATMIAPRPMPPAPASAVCATAVRKSVESCCASAWRS